MTSHFITGAPDPHNMQTQNIKSPYIPAHNVKKMLSLCIFVVLLFLLSGLTPDGAAIYRQSVSRRYYEITKQTTKKKKGKEKNLSTDQKGDLY